MALPKPDLQAFAKNKPAPGPLPGGFTPKQQKPQPQVADPTKDGGTEHQGPDDDSITSAVAQLQPYAEQVVQAANQSGDLAVDGTPGPETIAAVRAQIETLEEDVHEALEEATEKCTDVGRAKLLGDAFAESDAGAAANADAEKMAAFFLVVHAIETEQPQGEQGSGGQNGQQQNEEG